MSAWPRTVKRSPKWSKQNRSEEHTSELQSQSNLVCRLLLEKKKNRFIRMDQILDGNEKWIVRYLANDARLQIQSPLTDGFALPSAFPENFYQDHSSDRTQSL